MENQENLYSKELQDFVELNELTFEEIVRINPEDLLNLKSFNWRIMAEVLAFSEFEEL